MLPEMTDTIGHEDSGGRAGHDPDDPDTSRPGRGVPDVALTTAEAARVAGVSARTVRR